ncbi:MAG: hypothetical protein J7517_14160 [Sphingobium yanoikuyae]|uniref:hypothetical protein n=1 Tax=Sphingobium yanoikuyae TaxID=13690 RepID=UPI001B1F5DCA|nr:hypothetical protein [Sphingobium yanoikuyae]
MSKFLPEISFRDPDRVVPKALQGPCQFAESPENRASVRADHIHRTKITPTVGTIFLYLAFFA